MQDKPDLIYSIEDRPPLRETMFLGLQHYLTMFGSTVAIPLILSEPLGLADRPAELAQLIGTMFFVSGIVTLLQTTFGNRLPLVQGGTFSFLAPAIAVCGMAGGAEVGFEVKLQHIQGAVIAGSLFEIFVGYTGLVGKMMRFVTPITIAPTIALIGLALFKFGAPEAGRHWGIGGLTIVLIILFSQYLRRSHRLFELFPVLLGLVGAWGVAWLLTVGGVFEVRTSGRAGSRDRGGWCGAVGRATPMRCRDPGSRSEPSRRPADHCLPRRRPAGSGR